MRWRKEKKTKKTRKVSETKHYVGDTKEVVRFAYLIVNISKYNRVFFEKYTEVSKYTVSYLADDTVGVVWRKLFGTFADKGNALYSWKLVSREYYNK